MTDMIVKIYKDKGIKLNNIHNYLQTAQTAQI